MSPAQNSTTVCPPGHFPSTASAGGYGLTLFFRVRDVTGSILGRRPVMLSSI
jgi:hypothetical protein